MDTSHVLEHGTSGYVRILEEYGSVSCDFCTAIRLISHSVGISPTPSVVGSRNLKLLHEFEMERKVNDDIKQNMKVA